MSAFLVSQDHINALVTFGVGHGVTPPYGDINWPEIPPIEQGLAAHVAAIGAALRDENMRSLRARYGDADAVWGADAAGYTFQIVNVPAVIRAKYPNAKLDKPGECVSTICQAIVAAACCYDYQACETNGYNDTWAAKYLDAVRDRAREIGKLEDDDRGRGFWGL